MDSKDHFPTAVVLNSCSFFPTAVDGSCFTDKDNSFLRYLQFLTHQAAAMKAASMNGAAPPVVVQIVVRKSLSQNRRPVSSHHPHTTIVAFQNNTEFHTKANRVSGLAGETEVEATTMGPDGTGQPGATSISFLDNLEVFAKSPQAEKFLL